MPNSIVPAALNRCFYITKALRGIERGKNENHPARGSIYRCEREDNVLQAKQTGNV